jgi:hypothetical protein
MPSQTPLPRVSSLGCWKPGDPFIEINLTLKSVSRVIWIVIKIESNIPTKIFQHFKLPIAFYFFSSAYFEKNALAFYKAIVVVLNVVEMAPGKFCQRHYFFISSLDKLIDSIEFLSDDLKAGRDVKISQVSTFGISFSAEKFCFNPRFMPEISSYTIISVTTNWTNLFINYF